MKKLLSMMLAGIVLFAACKNHGPYELGHSSSTADTVTTDTAAVAQNSKLVKIAGIHFKVKNVRRCSEQIGALTTAYQGMVTHHDISSTAGFSKDYKLNDDSVVRVSSFQTRGEMTVSIPQEKLEAFTDSVSHLGAYVNSSRLDIDDKSLDYLSAKLKMNNRAELVKQQKDGKVIIKNPTAVINLKDDLVDQKIDNLKIDRDVKYSTVSLTFYQNNTVLKEILVDDNPSAYELPFFKRLALAFTNGWRLFTELILLLTNLWMLLGVAVVVLIVIRNYRIKRRHATAII